MLKTSGSLLLVAVSMVGRAWAQPVEGPPPGFTALFDGKSLEGWHGGTTYDPRTIKPEEQAKWDSDVPVHWCAEVARS